MLDFIWNFLGAVYALGASPDGVADAVIEARLMHRLAHARPVPLLWGLGYS